MATQMEKRAAKALAAGTGRKRGRPRKVDPKDLSVLQGGEQLLRDTMDHLQGQLEILDVRQRELPVGGFDPKLANASSTLGRAATALGAEIRKFDAHTQAAVKLLTHEQEDEVILDYIQNMAAPRRQKFLDLLRELQDGSLLG